MDWIRFLDENQIHYVTRGPNTKSGEVSIHCPLCGDDDPSEHLGINLSAELWGCHRNEAHRGKSTRYLVKIILGCSSNQAQAIVRQYSHSDPDTLEAALDALNEDVFPHVIEELRKQYPDPEYRAFSRIRSRGITSRFFRYLQERGYDNPQDIIQEYGLRCALVGRYKDRIIIPIYLNGELLGWTSRAIGAPKNAPRYLASNEEVKTTVFNYDQLKKGGTRLFIVEGPFDAIRTDSAGYGYRATCTFGTSVTVSQLALLRNLVKNFNDAWILFDRGAEEAAARLSDWIGVKVATLPYNVEDPGELSPKHLEHMSKYSFKGYFPAGRELSELISATLKNRSTQLAHSLRQNNALLKRLYKP